MFIRNLLFIFMILGNINLAFASDIETKNIGEKAMIESLREAINQNIILNSSRVKIILGAGTSGCAAFKTPAQQGEINILLTWQWLNDLKNIDSSTIIVVPRHAIDERFVTLEKKGVKLIPISGVLHTKKIENVMSEDISDIDISISYIVMLAGDTQQENGRWIKFDKNMLSEFLKNLPHDKKILILNGPRTGKFKENVDEMDEKAHKSATDYITQAVREQNMPNWEIIDFKYGQKSYWDKALKFCITYPGAALILPGESTSMISEALSLGILPIIYEHSAMTPVSFNYVKDLSWNKQILNYPNMTNTRYQQSPIEDQAKKIVEALVKIIQNHDFISKDKK